MRNLISAALAGAALLALAGCDAGAAATAEAAPVKVTKIASKSAAPRTAGEPAWAANKSHSAAENAAFQFEKNGADFGARSMADYVAKANAFAARPPKGTEMATRRNGDVLFYDPKDNVFAVVTADGAPRTLFKPKGDGMAYWRDQKAKAQQQASRRLSENDG